jgi:transposase
MKLYKSKYWLASRYIEQHKSITQIAKEAGASEQVIQYWLEKFELIRSPRSWTR